MNADDLGPLFDGEEGKRRKDEAIDRVEENADPEWKVRALRAVRVVISQSPEGFTTDDVYAADPELLGGTHEPRAMGAVMRKAAKLRLCVATKDYRNTKRPVAHRNPKRVWRAF